MLCQRWHTHCNLTCMEKQIITVILNNKPYNLTLEIEQKGNETIYRVAEDQDARQLRGIIPDNLEFNVNGHVELDHRIRTVEGEEIARTIWQAIRDYQEGL